MLWAIDTFPAQTGIELFVVSIAYISQVWRYFKFFAHWNFKIKGKQQMCP